MDDRLPEICGAVAVDSPAGIAMAQKWWSHREQEELLRFGRRPVDQIPAADELIGETDLVGLLDAAWGEGLLSNFAKRQLFQLMMRRYEEDPDGLWASGGSAET
ncbi:MAG: hypothetical protein WD942_11730 [Dehalococcoidia bacterium]